MVERISLEPETVQVQKRKLDGVGEDVGDAGTQWDGSTRGNTNFFEQMLEGGIKKVSQALGQSGERLHEGVQGYSQRLDSAVDILVQTEESQMDIISRVQARVDAMPTAYRTGSPSLG